MSETGQATPSTASAQAGPSNAATSRDPIEIRPTPSRMITAPAISLVDHTSSPNPKSPAEEEETADVISPTDSLNRRFTRQSLQQSLANRKYAKYQEDRLFVHERQPSDLGTGDDQGRLSWGKKKVKGLLKTKRQFQLAQKEDAAIDVLWENQRGWWAFGIPHFSSRSLLNFDPKPWLNVHRKPSPVDITNAQVPDPDWEWAWKSWYVDMSRDVDEEGWEYSFAFHRGFAWHGNHPWGHSWVRRRRWLRKRVRKHAHHTENRPGGQKHMSEAHHLNADYFTIHPSNNLSRSNSFAPSSLLAKVKQRREEEYSEEPADIKDIGTLLTHLKRAALDREKIVLVRYFVENAGEDVYYLEAQMASIMSLCIFQNSRRQLLSMLMEKCDAASRHRDEHLKHGKDEGPLEKRRIDNLMRAIKAADDQVKKLEYWSDQRMLVHEGHGGTAPDDDEGWTDEWQGLDNSGPGSNAESTAKEKGKQVEEVVRQETREQISPPDSDSEADSHSEVLEQEEQEEQEDVFSDPSDDEQAQHGSPGDEDESRLDKVSAEEERTLSPTGRNEGRQQESSSDAKYETADEDQKMIDAEARLDEQQFGASHETAGEDPRLIEHAKDAIKGKDRAGH